MAEMTEHTEKQMNQRVLNICSTSHSHGWASSAQCWLCTGTSPLSYAVLAPMHFTPDLFPSFPLPWSPPAAVRLSHCKITLPVIPFLDRIYMPFIWSFYMLYSYLILHLFLL